MNNDRFKFRAWQNGRFLYGAYYRHEGDHYFYSSKSVCVDEETGTFENQITRFQVLPENIMQCTGLKDKGGALIHEGDLLRIPEVSNYEKDTFNCFEVFFHNGDCSGQNVGFVMNRMHTQGHSAGGQGYRFIPSVLAEFEIIGNIHETPHLLKATS